ncbi:hypothetical protein N7523_007140 [Penicillium sp. IBT 18751x]|nr:hypothetical protein N7523_007140 [Penicillium sp. IBT 18751x]
MSARFDASDSSNQGGSPGGNFDQQASPPASSIEGATPADDQIAVPENIEAELRHYNLLLEQLLGLISSGEEESVSRVISVIRSGGSHRQILDIIEQQSESKSPAGKNGVK